MQTTDSTVSSYTELERGVHAALETYSNVHRGSGQFSMVTTHLYEQARNIVLDYLELNKARYVVIFCTPGGAEALMSELGPESYKSVSSADFGLPLGVRALAVDKKALKGRAPIQTGGGTTTLVSPGWVIWANAPDRFEAGTPAIINVIAFARALCLIRKYGDAFFMNSTTEELSAVQILYHDELEKYSGRELLEKLRLTLIGQNISVPTAEGSKPYINLDNSASTPAFTPVWNAVCQAWRQPGKIQQEIIREVRSICSDMLGVSPETYELIFTSNTTEAINLAAESLSLETDPETDPVVLSTILEHTSNDLPWRMIPGISLIRLNADNEGFLDLNELDTVLASYNHKHLYGKKRIVIMAVSGASNVLGSFNDLEEISRIVHNYGARLMVDAAQLVAHRKVGIERCRIDYLTFSAHKVYAPFGTGVLVVRKGLLNFETGKLEKIKLSGEENSPGIAALGKAFVLMQRIGLDLIRAEEQALTTYALRELAQIKGLTIYGTDDPSSPRFANKGGVIVFTLKGLMSDKVAKELSLRGGIGVRYGCHCAHILVKHILGVTPSLERFQKIIARLFRRLRFPGVARVSFGIGNTSEDIDTLIHVINKITARERVLNQKEIERQMNDFTRNASM
ncbi:aminotransferase class V-fold PLP-dependent enzyme, partial [bacterium]|nr:aminotransferase class V-fold PLP-dependent enzyme [bacterium]